MACKVSMLAAPGLQRGSVLLTVKCSVTTEYVITQASHNSSVTNVLNDSLNVRCNCNDSLWKAVTFTVYYIEAHENSTVCRKLDSCNPG